MFKISMLKKVQLPGVHVRVVFGPIQGLWSSWAPRLPPWIAQVRSSSPRRSHQHLREPGEPVRGTLVRGGSRHVRQLENAKWLRRTLCWKSCPQHRVLLGGVTLGTLGQALKTNWLNNTTSKGVRSKSERNQVVFAEQHLRPEHLPSLWP